MVLCGVELPFGVFWVSMVFGGFRLVMVDQGGLGLLYNVFWWVWGYLWWDLMDL